MVDSFKAQEKTEAFFFVSLYSVIILRKSKLAQNHLKVWFLEVFMVIWIKAKYIYFFNFRILLSKILLDFFFDFLIV